MATKTKRQDEAVKEPHPTDSAASGAGTGRTAAPAKGSASGPGFSSARPGRLRRALYRSSAYDLLLGRRPPARAIHQALDPWPGNEETANRLFRGIYGFAGLTLTAPNEPPWRLHGADEEWRAEAHGFAWLRHFAASESETAQRHAQALVLSWLKVYSRWHVDAWAPEVLARRLISWLGHFPMITRGERPGEDAVTLSLVRQARHLAHAVPRDLAPGPARLTAALGLVYAGVCLPGHGRLAERGLALAAEELDRVILEDGTHASRNASAQLAVLQDLVALRQLLLGAEHTVPEELARAIARAAPMLKFFRHRDGGLALFNGAKEGDRDAISHCLALCDADGRAAIRARLGGFERVDAGRATLFLDVGHEPPEAFATCAHHGPLSLEFSAGRRRIIVNCGHPERRSGLWAEAMRRTAAHSTLVIDDADAIARPLSPPHPDLVTATRAEEDGATLIDAISDGYGPPFGLSHRRRLYLSPDGDDLRGEDRVSGPGLQRDPGRPFAIRFHLHPEIHASPLQNGRAVLLRLFNGEGWQFLSDAPGLALEESVYLGGPSPRRSHQIVLSGVLDGETSVKWALHRDV